MADHAGFHRSFVAMRNALRSIVFFNGDCSRIDEPREEGSLCECPTCIAKAALENEEDWRFIGWNPERRFSMPRELAIVEAWKHYFKRSGERRTVRAVRRGLQVRAEGAVMQHGIECACDVCWPPLPEDTLWLIPEREQWERELWVWSERAGFWIRAPRVKVWRAGEAGKQLPILRTGCRTTIYGLSDFDVPFAGESDWEIAKYALEHAGIAMPSTVDLVRFLVEPEDIDGWRYNAHRQYKTSITVDPAHVVAELVMNTVWLPPPMENN